MTTPLHAAPSPFRPQACLVCGMETLAAGCCSSACAARAHQELGRNAALLRSRRLTPDDRRALAERNGRLSSALLRWQPSTASG
ncbi:hypothetical protein [Egicoccus sp. AB-alg2]|uniref:hypothetical protein n=1 Tax=Egicoccus sp. AB-alg2 TaxID=3242693 RepID=UPI00359E319E